MATPTLNLGLVVDDTEAEGPGRRFAVWTQGCSIRCPGCCNPELLDPVENDRWPAERLADRLAVAAARHGLEGVSFLGGEPTEQAAGLVVVAERARSLGLSVMLFSGYTLAELRDRGPDTAALLARCDLLVDGRYDARRRTTTRRFIGSDNQVLHFLTDRYRADDPRFGEPNTLELRLRVVDGVPTVQINGFPVRGTRVR